MSARAAALLKTSRKRYGGELLTISPASPAEAAAAAAAFEAGGGAMPPPLLAPVVVVDDRADKGKKKAKKKGAVTHYEFGEGPLGLGLDDAGGRIVIGTVAEGSMAAELGVQPGGQLLAINDQPVRRRPTPPAHARTRTHPRTHANRGEGMARGWPYTCERPCACE